ncbi:MAG: hypothetical protein AAGE94_01915 [Acidobacteriota bacterium]
MSTHRTEILDRWARQARAGRSPTREAWGEDLRHLGAIDRDTARRLTDGDVPRWPWIPPFEAIQSEELALRVVDGQERARLRRIAVRALDSIDLADEPTDEPTIPVPPMPMRPTPNQPSALDQLDSERGVSEQHASSFQPIRHRARPTLPTATRHPRPSVGRWILTLVGLITIASVLAILWVPDDPPATETWREQTSSPPTSTPTTARESSDLRAVETLVAELATALETSDDPTLVEIHDQHLVPLLTLEPDAWRARPELAAVVLELTRRRSGATVHGMAREAALISAVADGWLGGEPTPDSEPPLDALRSLIDWVEGEDAS